jgi:hypothetical protein
MAYEMKELSGSLFKNQKKEKDTHPNAQGSCLINGVEYWISSWTKEDKNGNKWQSLAFKPKEEKPAEKRKGGGSFSEMDSDIPFNKIGKYL